MTKEIIEDYTDYLSSVHDSIVSDIQLITSRLASKITDKFYGFLEDGNRQKKYSIILTNKDVLKHKIEKPIKEYFFSSINGFETFINRQNECLDLCIPKNLEIDFISTSINNKEMISILINKIMIQINEYIDLVLYKSNIEDILKDITLILINEINKFNRTKEIYTKNMINKTYEFYDCCSNDLSKVI